MDCSSFWKIDKIDKIVLSIILVFATFFSIFETFSFASESVSPVIIDNLTFSGSTFKTSEGQSIVAFPLIIGHQYRFESSSQYNRQMRFTSEFPSPGVGIVGQFSLPAGGEYSFVAQENFLFVTDAGTTTSVPNIVSNIKLTDETASGFAGVIEVLTVAVGSNSLWRIFQNSLPYLLILVLVSFGFLLIFSMIKGISKGKGRI